MPFISRSKSVARTREEFKAPSFQDVINVFGFPGALKLVDLFWGGIRRGREENSSLLCPGPFSFYERGADRHGQLGDYLVCVGDELGSLLDQLIRRKADRLRDLSRDARDSAAKFHGQAGGDGAGSLHPE